MFVPENTSINASPQWLPPSPWAWRCHRPALAAFAVICACSWLAIFFGVELPQKWIWIESLLIVAAAFTSVVGLARTLPTQNVVGAAGFILGLSTIIELVAVQTGVPFGGYTFTESFGFKLLGHLPWPIPLAWMTVILASRGVARLILRPWRKRAAYGLWVIGLTAALAVMLDLGLEPFGVVVKHYWVWHSGDVGPRWYHAPWINFFGIFSVTIFIMIFAMPWFINKQPVPQPVDYHPLVIWTCLNLLFVTGGAVHHLWTAAILGIVITTVVILAALKGAKNSKT